MTKTITSIILATIMAAMLGCIYSLHQEVTNLSSRLVKLEAMEEARWEGIQKADTTLLDTFQNQLEVNRYIFKGISEARLK